MKTTAKGSSRGGDASARRGRAHLSVVPEGEHVPVRRSADNRRVVIGPLRELSALTATHLRQILARVVDDDWSTSRASVVQVDLSAPDIGRADVRAVLADADEELQALGGRLVIVAPDARLARTMSVATPFHPPRRILPTA